MHSLTSPTPRRTAVTRIAIGVATLLAGGIAFAATPLGAAGGTDATFVAITPCRLFDTRPAPQSIGPRSTPLGEGEVVEMQVTGSNGDCTIPADATAVAINATSVGATADSYATFYPAGGERPHASSLNYVAGAAPTPNSIDVRLSANGRMAVFNAFGTVHLVGDVIGYYSHGALETLSHGLAAKADASDVYTTDEIDALLAGIGTGGYTDAEIDALLAGIDTAGYTDAEIDALLVGKADQATTYSSAEIDAAIVAAVAGKANSADVYTKAELDALHQLLYTKDEVDDLIYTETEIDALFQQVYSKSETDALLVDERAWLASVALNGDEIGSGFSSMQLGTGIYRVTFQLGFYDFPSTSDPIFTALPRCSDGNAANTAIFKDLAAGEITAVQVEIETRDSAGALIDCGVHVIMHMM